MNNEFIGQKCIFRGDRSGVFFGTLKERNNTEVLIEKCRRLWYWAGANTISDLAIKGTMMPKECKFTKAVNQILITDCIEIIPCSEQAITSIESVPKWTF